MRVRHSHEAGPRVKVGARCRLFAARRAVRQPIAENKTSTRRGCVLDVQFCPVSGDTREITFATSLFDEGTLLA